MLYNRNKEKKKSWQTHLGDNKFQNLKELGIC